ncbi:hypothetical protein EJP02_023 [Escherichia phage EJP2]|mgnify:CR=1 FL=1|nr:hypothetical protein EJP02_023 [Escherichia phage EJP2]
MSTSIAIVNASIRTNHSSVCIGGLDRKVEYSFIIAETINGARYILNDSEANHYYVAKDTGFKRIPADVVYAKMNKLVDRINAKGTIDLLYWTETTPAYGSHRYLNPGIKM